MKSILSTTNAEIFNQLYQKKVNSHILQIIFKQIVMI